MDGNGYPVADIWKEVNPLISIAFGNCILRFRRSISKMPKSIASYLETFLSYICKQNYYLFSSFD
jgi:hypothetical protein